MQLVGLAPELVSGLISFSGLAGSILKWPLQPAALMIQRLICKLTPKFQFNHSSLRTLMPHAPAVALDSWSGGSPPGCCWGSAAE